MSDRPGAAFEIYWAAPARRALRRLPEKVATAVVEFIYRPLATNPRRGDYRVVYRIDDRRQRVEVLAIGHRADIYRRD